MKKSKFIKSTFILLVGGFITKILGMLIKIVMTRLVGTDFYFTYCGSSTRNACRYL